MVRRRIGIGLGVCLIVSFWSCLCAQEEPPPDQQGAENAVFKDEPQARALYDRMIEALRRPQSLSYRSEFNWESRGREVVRCSCTVWLKKPNHFRVESRKADGTLVGTLVGDGDYLWTFWEGSRPWFSVEDRESYDKTKSNVYMKKGTPLARHSIGHEVGRVEAGTILDPSTFHGYTDSLQAYLDGVMGMGVEKVGDEECDVIEVSIMKRQRSWCLWLSRKDHLPRKLKEIVRVSYVMTMHETWSDIVIDGAIPAEKFVWTPPEGWQQWEMPTAESVLLKPGTTAPDFDLSLVDGSKVKLSDFRDKIVWFYIWRAG